MAKDAFRGNENLKRSDVVIDWTPEMVLEYKRCMEDPIYFIRKYMTIVSLDKGLIKFDLYDYQEDLIRTYTDEKRIICLSSRQSGKSITTIGFFLHYTLFNSHKTIAILANKGESARGLLARYKLAFERLPIWLQSGIVDWNKSSIELENGCKILAGSTSSSAVRSQSINILFLDEFAFVPSNLAEDFFKSVYPTISSGETTKIIIVSTANGMNHFYKMWHDAEEKRSNYIFKRIDWWQVPGRDAKWREDTVRATSEEQFAQEFGNEFVGSVGTLIRPNILKNMVFDAPISDIDGYMQYEMPIKGRSYVTTVDTSHGLGLDYSALTVFDVTEVPYTLVGKFKDNHVDPLFFPEIIYRIAMEYNEADVLIERNELGQQVAQILHDDLEYENIMSCVTSGVKGQHIGAGFSGKSQLGVRMTKQVKRVGCSNLKSLIEKGLLIVKDFDAISELTVFVRNKNSYEAEEGYNDDIVMCLVIFAWMTTQQYFKDITDLDVRAKLSKILRKQIEDDVLPFGFIGGDSYEVDGVVLEETVGWFH